MCERLRCEFINKSALLVQVYTLMRWCTEVGVQAPSSSVTSVQFPSVFVGCCHIPVHVHVCVHLLWTYMYM